MKLLNPRIKKGVANAELKKYSNAFVIERLLPAIAAFTLFACVQAWGSAGGAVGGGPFFLRVNDDYYAFFSEISVYGAIDGDVYLFFSRLTAETGTVNGKIYGFSSDADVSGGADFVSLLWTDIFETREESGTNIYYNNRIPDIIVRLGLAALRAGCVLIFFFVRRGFFEQGFCAAYYDIKSVVKTGLTVCFFCAALILIFLLSVVFSFVSALVFLFAAVLTAAGEASASIYVGRAASGAFDLEFEDKPLGYAALGLIIIETACLVPYVGGFINFVLMPVFASGIVCVNALNAFVYKKFYYAPY